MCSWVCQDWHSEMENKVTCHSFVTTTPHQPPGNIVGTTTFHPPKCRIVGTSESHWSAIAPLFCPLSHDVNSIILLFEHFTVPVRHCTEWVGRGAWLQMTGVLSLEYVYQFDYKWAPSSEFVSSSIPSWQISTAHAQPFRGARDLAFCLKVPLDSLLVWASSEGSG